MSAAVSLRSTACPSETGSKPAPAKACSSAALQPPSGPSAAITAFTQGQHTVQVVFWKVTENRTRSHSYSWTFSVY